MKKKSGQGYTMPLTTDRASLPISLGIVFVLAIFLSIAAQQPGGYRGGILWVLYLCAVTPWLLWESCRFSAKLQLTGEGIAVTLFGLTLRRFPAEQIRLFAGVSYRKKGHTRTRTFVRTCYVIAVCAAVPVSGAELSRYAGSFRRRIGIRKKHVLLLDWSPDRLRKLRRMYDAPWTDLTEDRALDAELSRKKR